MSNDLPAVLGFVAMLMASPVLANDVSMPSGGKPVEGHQIPSLTLPIQGGPNPMTMKDRTSEWSAAYRWPDPPPPESPPGAIGGFGAPITTTGGPFIAPTSTSDNELLQGLNRRAEQLREQMRARGQLSEP